MIFAIVNESSRVTDDQVEIMAKAVLENLKTFCAHYELLLPHVGVATTREDAPDGAYVAVLVDVVSDPEAVAFHTENEFGHVYLEISVPQVLDNGGAVLSGGSAGSSVAQALDHEVKETVADAHINLWSDEFDGWETAYEVCDPFQGDSIEQEVEYKDDKWTVLLSDYALTDWFDPQAPIGAAMSASGAGTVPFAIGIGGYKIKRAASQKTLSEFGEKPILEMCDTLQEWEKSKIRRRVKRRLAVKETPSGPPTQPASPTGKSSQKMKAVDVPIKG